jgi:CAS/CSE protein, C-terminus
MADGNTVSTMEGFLLVLLMQILQQQVTELALMCFRAWLKCWSFDLMDWGELFSIVLLSAAWLQQGNMPALAQLLKAYINKSPQDLVTRYWGYFTTHLSDVVVDFGPLSS